MRERFETFTVLIAKINRSIRKIKTAAMSEFNLKSTHVSCIFYLYKAGSMTATELSEVCEEDKGAVSRSIEYLEKNGYIVCDSDAPKRYKSPLRLTAKGTDIGERLVSKIDTVLSQVGTSLSSEMRLMMYQGLNTVCDDLQKISETYE